MGHALEQLGADWIPIEAHHLKATVDERGAPTLRLDGDPDLATQNIDKLALDGVVWRVTEGSFHHYANLLSLLAEHYPVVNDWQCTWICSDKWRTSAKLAEAGIPVVPTVLLTPDMSVPAFSGRKTVIKPSVSAEGNGVRLATPGTMPGITVPHVAQPLVPGPSRAHIRVIVCGSEPVAALHRIPGAQHAENEIAVNNIAAGGTPAPAPMDQVRDIAAAAARCVGGDILGVDFVPWGDSFAVLEVNSSPGFTGIAEALGVDCFNLAAEQVFRRIQAST